MASPWEQKWNEMKQGVEEVVGNASETLQNALPWARDWKAKATPQQAPAAPPEAPKALTVDDIMPRLIQAESRGVHIDEKGVLTTSPVGAQGITQLMPSTAAKPGYGIAPVKDKSEAEYLRVGKAYLQKMYEKFGDWEKALAAYNAGVGNVMKAEGKAERFGGDWKDYLPRQKETLPYIKKIMKPEDMKPISSLKGQQLAATDVKMPRALEAAGEFAQAAGEGVQDAALAMGAGVTGSSVAAVVAENVFDPLNMIPGAKGAVAVGAIASKDFLKLFPKFASTKVVDNEGLPLVVYHGQNLLPKQKAHNEGIWFGDAQTANLYAKGEGGNVEASFIDIKKPTSDLLEWNKSVKAKDGKYDGYIATWGDGQTVFAVADPKQIQSAISPKGMKVGAESTVENTSFIPSKYIKTPYDHKNGYSSVLNNPIHLGDNAPPGLAGARLSGFTDPNNKYFHGYDKNGEKFTIPIESVNPDWVVSSKDGNKTAEFFKERMKGK